VAELVSATEIFPAQLTSEFGVALALAFDQIQPLLLLRGMQGQVRRCHGDLHLGNVALIDGAPVLYDALEFDDTIATCDVLYDLAFLLMDLSKLGRNADAALLLDRYLAASDDAASQVAGLSALPLFLSLRAAIRAKVVGAMFRLNPEKPSLKDDALAYLLAAMDNLAGPRWVNQPNWPEPGCATDPSTRVSTANSAAIHSKAPSAGAPAPP
jgi:aminoglycoside phosphotransferase family enzyme